MTDLVTSSVTPRNCFGTYRREEYEHELHLPHRLRGVLLLISTKSRPPGRRTALSIVLIAASFALAGCATSSPTTSRTAHTPSPTPSAPAGYYADAAAKYAITFPGKPSVAPIAGTEAERATYSTEADPTTPTAVYFTSGGTITASAFTTTYEDLEGGLFQMINQGMKLTSGEKKFKLDGMPAVESDFTDPAGKPGAVLLAGKGHSFYQLIVRGGTSKEQQTFFDSFKLLG